VKAVILAGGKGTRLRPFTAVLPKPLVPLGDMPVLEIVIRQLRHHGFRELVVCAGHLAQLIMAFFGDGRRFGVSIEYSVEDEPLGTAGPLARLRGLDDDFLVLNGDLLTSLSFSRLLAFHREQRADATIGVHRRRIEIDFGVVELDSEQRLARYTEKPVIEHDVSMGVNALSPRALRFVPPGKRLDIPELMTRIRDGGGRVLGYREDCYWLDIGRAPDYEAAQNEFESKKALFLPEDA
jgi:NDP-sugar pyrophosphorylase family protein